MCVLIIPMCVEVGKQPRMCKVLLALLVQNTFEHFSIKKKKLRIIGNVS